MAGAVENTVLFLNKRVILKVVNKHEDHRIVSGI